MIRFLQGGFRSAGQISRIQTYRHLELLLLQSIPSLVRGPVYQSGACTAEFCQSLMQHQKQDTKSTTQAQKAFRLCYPVSSSLSLSCGRRSCRCSRGSPATGCASGAGEDHRQEVCLPDSTALTHGILLSCGCLTPGGQV